MYQKSKSNSILESIKNKTVHVHPLKDLLAKYTHKKETTVFPTLQVTPGDAYCTSINWQPKEYLPSDITETEEVHSSTPYVVNQGSCPDLRDCAIKRLFGRGSHSVKERFTRQIEVWEKASNADCGVYFLPLIGYVMEGRPNELHFCTVTPWMRNGDAEDYFRSNRHREDGVDKRQFILKLAKGLTLLHQLGLIHGYIKASHILVSNTGDPLIGDFGLCRPKEETKFDLSSLPNSNDPLRWIPREMMEEDSPRGTFFGTISQKADVFMFGMTVLEIMTGKKPFAEILNENCLFGERHRNILPQRPVGEATDAIDDSLWELLLRCWALEPEDRPTMQDVLIELEGDGSKRPLIFMI